MKRIFAVLLITALCLSSVFCLGSAAAFAAGSLQVKVYDTDLEGLALKANPDINASRYLLVPEGELLNIDQIINGWGHTTYKGQPGWVSLRYTSVVGDYAAESPYYGFINPVYYTIYNTDGEGLELRIAPTVETSTFGPIPEGTAVLVSSIEGEWAYTSYNGHYGWSNIAHLRQESFRVDIYDTDGEGLALKAAPNINAQRYFFLYDGTTVDIDGVTGDGWGHTNYNGYSGWIALRYTRINGAYQTIAPSYGFITPTSYIVHDTQGEGLELRTKPSIESSTFGPIPDGTIVTVEALIGDWAYTSYNGRYGWANHAVYLSPLGSQPSAPGNYQEFDLFTFLQGVTLGRKGLAGAAVAYITFGSNGSYTLGGDVSTLHSWSHTDGSGRFINVYEIFDGIYSMEMADVRGTTSGGAKESDGSTTEYVQDLSRLNGDIYYLILSGSSIPDGLGMITDNGSLYDALGGYTDAGNRASRTLLWEYGTSTVLAYDYNNY